MSMTKELSNSRYFLCRMLDGKHVTVRMLPEISDDRTTITDLKMISQSTIDVDSRELLIKVEMIRNHYTGKSLASWFEDDPKISGL